MVLRSNFLAIFALIFLCSVHSLDAVKQKRNKKAVAPATADSAVAKNDLQPHKNPLVVRVLLDEKDHGSEPWRLQSKEGFLVVDPHEKSKQLKTEVKELVVACKHGQVLINNKKVGNQVVIMPQGPTITLSENRYGGSLWVVVDGATVKLINCIDIESYVACVLMTESWPGWPLEVNKVFAIAVRTYVIAMVKAAKTNKQIYHVKNTNKHQTYSGDHNCQIFKDAVAHTQGLFLVHNNKPIIAMYDACCGGLVPAHMNDINAKDAPYLARKRACTFCKTAKVYSWEVEYHIDAFAEIMKQEVPALRKMRDCRVTHKDKAGIVKEVMLKGHTHVPVAGKKIYSLVKGVKSFCFDVHVSGSRVKLKGRGLGHHKGLCQWGAKEMVDQGYEYKDILTFYYPGTNLMRIM